MAGAFSQSAMGLAQHGLAVIPLGGDDGKTPLVRHGKWKRRPGKAFLAKLSGQFPDANVGVICALSGVTVVDIDDPTVTDKMVDRCGDTPLKMGTPRGGVHLWYRNNGEQSVVNLRGSDGPGVDVKAAGGLIVAPPSIRPSGEHAGKPYTFLTGSWDDVGELPFAKSGSLPMYDETPIQAPQVIKKGRRNKSLLGQLLKQARACDDFDALLDVARSHNEHFLPPMTDAEVTKTAHSAWNMEISNKNWAGQEVRAVALKSELEKLGGHGDAALLLLTLRAIHGRLGGGEFILSNAITERFGWSIRRLKSAINCLVGQGFIEIAHEGGQGPKDPRIARLPLGEQNAHQYNNNTLSPSPMASEGKTNE